MNWIFLGVFICLTINDIHRVHHGTSWHHVEYPVHLVESYQYSIVTHNIIYND